MTQPGHTLATERSARVVASRKLLRRARRTEAGEFLADGPQAVREAVRWHRTKHPREIRVVVRQIFAAPHAFEAYADLVNDATDRDIRVVAVTDKALAGLSEAVTPQGIVAQCAILDKPVDDVLDALPKVPLVAVPVDVRDPGNAGTIIRCADAAGADAVFVAGESVDVYNSKTVRASVGSIFHVPIARADDPADLVRRLQEAGLVVIATEGEAAADLDEIIDTGILAKPTAWLFGNEAHGLPDELAALADVRVRIPIRGLAESLNLSTAAAICLFASARAHRP
ncbi:TrmH family RNA methyltransferase [Antricoccus suffuscus]|uniref:TrmH family RNA methyltransferase n=1 Tax=Antricoccus suffuscus TaxID=1629062 RepID=A0A2T0ZWP8_9ACTN|nr:RNA methyltransferase [Antricoccus suffuscus]PRZ40677.1 TrmH family RNA methyltransferase [Antricoccus suffuscus]